MTTTERRTIIEQAAKELAVWEETLSGWGFSSRTYRRRAKMVRGLRVLLAEVLVDESTLTTEKAEGRIPA